MRASTACEVKSADIKSCAMTNSDSSFLLLRNSTAPYSLLELVPLRFASCLLSCLTTASLVSISVIDSLNQLGERLFAVQSFKASIRDKISQGRISVNAFGVFFKNQLDERGGVGFWNKV